MHHQDQKKMYFDWQYWYENEQQCNMHNPLLHGHQIHQSMPGLENPKKIRTYN